MISVAIAGTGGYAAVHASVWSMMKGVRLIAVLGGDPQRAASFAKEHGIQNHYADPDAFMSMAGDIDVLDVVTVPSTHVDTARKLMRSARKGVMIEKPLDADPAKAVSFFNEVTGGGLAVGVVSQLRYGRLFTRVGELLTEGACGELDHFSIHLSMLREGGYYGGRPWRDDPDVSGGGVLMSQAIHRLNFVFSLIGYDVQGVFAVGGPSRHAVNVEEAVTAVIKMQTGVTGSVYATTLCPSANDRIELEGSDGKISADLRTCGITVSGRAVGGASRTEKVGQEGENLLYNQFAKFIEMLKDGSGGSQNLREAVNDVIVIGAMYRSISGGGPVAVEGLVLRG